MKIQKINFEKKEIEISETFIDSDGRTKERIRKVLAPTGRVSEKESQVGNEKAIEELPDTTVD